ncbi:MAG: hypothetical protein KF852_01210 [Saprospiraceae bacterium]|nr:hypothetical protein [Saprospiraceae bacterium]
MPQSKNFSPSQYQNKGKIWDIRSANNGVIYMAADKGLLEFDGKTWNTYKGSEGFIRSLLVVNDSLLYTGSDLDFGVWTRNKYRAWEYTSLYPFRKNAGDINEEFWDIHRMQDDIVFVSSQNIYLYKNEKIIQIRPPNIPLAGSFSVADALYVAVEKKGLFTLNGTSLKQVFQYPDGRNFEISGIYKSSEGITIVTKNAGLYRYAAEALVSIDNPLSQNLKTAKVFSFEPLGPTHLAFGTVLKGLYITNLDGKIIHHINKYKGLPSNTVLCLHFSPAKKLWVGTDYGVSAFDLGNNLTYFYDYRGDFGTAHAALLKDNIFYLGTNQGLYRARWEALNNDSDFASFQLVPGTEGQVWTLEYIDDHLWIGHDRGLFTLRGNTLQSMGNQQGIWTIVPYKNYLLTGNYNGISIFKKENNVWNFFKKMELILGSCNQLIVEKENTLWVNIPNYGIIRATLDDNLYPTEREIMIENNFEGDNPYLIAQDGRILLVTDQVQYIFDERARKFIKTDIKIYYPAVQDLLSNVYQPLSLSSNYDFYPIYNGFALKHLQNSEEKDVQKHALIIRKIEAFNNEHKFLFHPDTTIPYRLNNLKIECIVPNRQDVLYQYKLNDGDEWSQWTTNNTFEFFGLSQGQYNLSVRAKIDEEIIADKIITFQIDTPWYYAWYAYLLYGVLTLGLLYLVRRWQKVSLLKQKKQLLKKEQHSLRRQAEKHRQEIMQMEQEQLKKEYEQLKWQLKNKTIELANKAKDNEDKNRLLLTLKSKLEDAQLNPAKAKIRWNEMQRLLDSYLDVEDKTFEIQMDELHQAFFKKLKERHPGLSNNDLRLCAYLKIGLSTKEIAEILNILPSSAFITRSRLRKKLNLAVDEDFHTFFNAL